jgi:hypothetical protein
MRMTLGRGGRHVPFLLAVAGVGVLFLFLHRDGRVPARSERWDEVWLVVAAVLLLLEMPSLVDAIRRWTSGGDRNLRPSAPARKPPIRLLLIPLALMTTGLTALAAAFAVVIRWSADLNVIAVVAITATGFALFGASILLSLSHLAAFSAQQRRALRRALSQDDDAAPVQ